MKEDNSKTNPDSHGGNTGEGHTIGREDVGKMLQSWTRLMAIMGSAVCHDMNNPLQGVLGFVDLLLQTENDSKRNEDLAYVFECSLQCREFSDDLGRLVQRYPIVHSEFDVEAFWEGVLSHCSSTWAEKKLCFETSVNVVSPPSEIEPHYFLLILFGVVGNACEKAFAGDSIKVSLVVGGSDRIRLKVGLHPHQPTTNSATSRGETPNHSGFVSNHLLWLAGRAARLEGGRLEGDFDSSARTVLVILPLLEDD